MKIIWQSVSKYIKMGKIFSPGTPVLRICPVATITTKNVSAIDVIRELIKNSKR